IAGDGFGGIGAITTSNTGGATAYTNTGAVTLANNASVGAMNADGELRFGGSITDGSSSYSLTKVGSGTVRLNGTANFFDAGLFINPGTLALGVSNALDSANMDVFVASGATFDLGSSSEGIDALTGAGTVI